MWKKTLCLIVCFVLLLLPSCAENGKTGENAEGVPCPIEGLEWGMTVDESLAALSLTEEDVEIDSSVENMVSISATLAGNQEAYGYPIQEINLVIYEDFNGLPVGLTNMAILFGASPTVDELDSAVKEQVKAYTVENSENATNPVRIYQTSKTLADAEQTLVEKYFKWSDTVSGIPMAVPEQDEIYYGRVSVGESVGETCAWVDNTCATVLEKAAEAENK